MDGVKNQFMKKQFTGGWRLVCLSYVGDNKEKEYPFGQDAIGYIYYSETGIMALQIYRNPDVRSSDPMAIPQDCIAYFGRYEIDSERSVVRHILEGQLIQDDPAKGKVAERQYHFEGDKLSLRPVDNLNIEALWQRV